MVRGVGIWTSRMLFSAQSAKQSPSFCNDFASRFLFRRSSKWATIRRITLGRRKREQCFRNGRAFRGCNTALNAVIALEAVAFNAADRQVVRHCAKMVCI